MEECQDQDLTIFNINTRAIEEFNFILEFECFKFCSRGNKQDGEKVLENYGCVDGLGPKGSGFIYMHGERLDGDDYYDDDAVEDDDEKHEDYFICLCNSESPLDAAIMERKCNWHFRVETCNTHDECNRYEACMEECEDTLNLNKSGCSKICSHWKN